MLTFTGDKTVIHYNSDMSGDIIIKNVNFDHVLEIPANDIINFMGEYVRNKKIEQLEDMDNEEILGIK